MQRYLPQVGRSCLTKISGGRVSGDFPGSCLMGISKFLDLDFFSNKKLFKLEILITNCFTDLDELVQQRSYWRRSGEYILANP